MQNDGLGTHKDKKSLLREYPKVTKKPTIVSANLPNRPTHLGYFEISTYHASVVRD